MDTREYLDVLVNNKNFSTAVVWLFAFFFLLMVPFFLGLYYGLRRWGEDYMRIALLGGVVAALLGAESAMRRCAAGSRQSRSHHPACPLPGPPPGPAPRGDR